jgi:hypothetical protein
MRVKLTIVPFEWRSRRVRSSALRSRVDGTASALIGGRSPLLERVGRRPPERLRGLLDLRRALRGEHHGHVRLGTAYSQIWPSRAKVAPLEPLKTAGNGCSLSHGFPTGSPRITSSRALRRRQTCARVPAG